MIRMPAAVRTAASLFPLFAIAMLQPVLASTVAVCHGIRPCRRCKTT